MYDFCIDDGGDGGGVGGGDNDGRYCFDFVIIITAADFAVVVFVLAEQINGIKSTLIELKVPLKLYVEFCHKYTTRRQIALHFPCTHIAHT